MADLDRDLVVLVESSSPHDPVMFLEWDETAKTSATMLSLVPSFSLREQKCEIIFLVDRSGSMSGQGIIQAKQALLLFVHSLPSNCIFDIYSFGSRFDHLFSRSEEYTDESLGRARCHIESMDANYGGTEIYAPLEDIFRKAER